MIKFLEIQRESKKQRNEKFYVATKPIKMWDVSLDNIVIRKLV